MLTVSKTDSFTFKASEPSCDEARRIRNKATKSIRRKIQPHCIEDCMRTRTLTPRKLRVLLKRYQQIRQREFEEAETVFIDRETVRKLNEFVTNARAHEETWEVPVVSSQTTPVQSPKIALDNVFNRIN